MAAKSITTLLSEAAALDAALKARPEADLLKEFRDILNSDEMKGQLAAFGKIATALPASQVPNVIVSLLNTYQACVVQTDIRLNEISPPPADDQQA